MRRLLLAVALLSLSVVITGCSEQKVPAGNVAQVKEAPLGLISKGDYDRWLVAAGARDGNPMALPVPPDFKGCVEAQKADISQPEKRERCRARLQALRSQTMNFLISSRWILGQAKQEGLTVTDSQVAQALSRQLASFPSRSAKEKFLRDSKMSMEQLRFRTRLNLLASSLRKKAAGGPVTPSEEQIKDFYKINAKRFGQPESREVELVTTATADKAILAKVLIEQGASFAEVSRRYGSTPEARSRPTRITISRGREVGPDLERAVFAARKGKLTGPVQGGYVYYVFRVLSVTPSTRQSLSQARPLVAELLEAQIRRERVSQYLDRLEGEWKGRTLCAPGYIVAECSNGS